MIRATILFTVLAAAALAHAETPLPAYILHLPPSVSDIFIAETDKATIHRYERTQTGLTLGEDGYMSIGRNGAGKKRAWDRKTPLGIYFVVDQLDTSRMHEKYGITAFPLDYPNTWDRREKRTGDGIWVHGVAPGDGRRPRLDTGGCIALPNDDLRALEERFVPLVTPVIVTRELRWQATEAIDALRIELQTVVHQWAKHFAAGDIHAYLSMYADDFGYRGMRLNEWASFRQTMLGQRGAVDIDVDDLLLLADPEEDGLYLSRFRQIVSKNDKSTTTIKRLYWRRHEDGTFKIVAEDNG